MLPTDVDRLIRRVAELKPELEKLVADATDLATQLDLPAPQTLQSLDAVWERARILDEAPALSQSALACDAWDRTETDIMALLSAGAEHAAPERRLSESLRAQSMDTPVHEDRAQLTTLGNLTRWDAEAFARLDRLEKLLPELED